MHAALTVLAILFGWLLTTATAWAIGTVVLRRAALVCYAAEERLLAFLVGSAILSLIVFALCAAKIAHKGVYLAIDAAVIGYALYSGAHRPKGEALPALPRLWFWIFTVPFAVFTGLYLTNALTPETSADGMAYHLGLMVKYYRAHGFFPITTNMYASLSEGIELLFLHAFSFGRHSAAALVHYSFFLCVTFLILSYGRRIGRPAVGVAAAIFFYASPIVGLDGTIAYNDVALAAVLFGLFYLLQIWEIDKNPKLLAAAGILTGFGYAIKYTAFLAVPYTLGFVVWKLWKDRRPVLRPVLAISALALVFILPWMVKDWIVVANPVAPFANRIFTNPYVHVSLEQDYRAALRMYSLKSYWQIPWEITVSGNLTQGLFGPLFLLAPLALLSLRFREGRQLLLAGVFFSLTYWTNVGTRFLIPSLPFLSLALALALSKFEWLLLILVAGHSILSWPDVAKRYCHQYAYRLVKVSPEAALRIIPEEEYLESNFQYSLARTIERVVPPGGKVFTYQQPGESYMTRELLVSYQSAFNESLRDVLLTPIIAEWQPSFLRKFEFPEREVRGVRVVQTASYPQEQWSVSELRVFDGTRELSRDPDWRISARPNPWDIQMAFDNSPVTRWRSWQPMEAGMFIEVTFGSARKLSSVLLESSLDTQAARFKLEGMGGDGKWALLSDRTVDSVSPIRENLRMAATMEFKARGVQYLMIDPTDAGYSDFATFSGMWGIKLLADNHGVHVYRIE